MTERNQYYDFLKGMAIIMVVGIHTFAGAGFTSSHELFNTCVRQILNCAVPIFIACSGFFLANKTLNNKETIKCFYKKQISRVYIPCLLWSIPWFLLNLLTGHSVLKETINLFFCGYSVYYFVILMIQYYLLLPWIQKINRKLGGVLLGLSLLSSLICVSFVVFLTAIKGFQIPLTLYAGPFPLWIVFFVIGVFMSSKKRDYKVTWLIPVLVVSLLLQVIETKHLVSQSLLGLGYGIKPTSFVFSIIVVICLFSGRIERLYNPTLSINRIIGFIGRISFVIYLSHTLVILLVSRIAFYNSLLWSVRFVLITVLDIALVFLLSRFVPSRYKRIVGF